MMKNIIKSLSTLGVGILIGILTTGSQNPIIERCEADHSKDYQVACILNDICHMAMDYEQESWKESLETGDTFHMYAGFEELYYDIIQNLDCYGVDSVCMRDFENYHWAY